ncbi:MAG: helix-hairpin-helix domain-containing protein [Lachnospiraceae bacterium]|nr:helix-hairpin-helix domain-containing protein [Lachnospiraceae bacterium]
MDQTLKESATDKDTTTEQNAKGTFVAPDAKSENADTNSTLAVYVCGHVRQPGVYYLPRGSRVTDAVLKAGGFTKDASLILLNLATVLEDGQQIYVPSKKEEEGSKPDGVGMNPSGATGGEGLVNLNSATKEELMTLPGIGESKADSILSYRENNGRFQQTEELMNIPGIKQGVFDKIKDKICI